MRKTRSPRSAAIEFFAVFMVFLGMGCAGHQQGTTTALKARRGGKERTTIATVTNIDRDHQIVSLREADGDVSTVLVSDSIILGRMDVGDRVRVDLQESLGFELLEPGQAIDKEEFTSETMPAGVLFGRQVATTVEILKVTQEGESTTFRSKDGSVHKLEGNTKAKRTKLARLRPGDDVAASCTEKLSIKLQR